MEYFQLNLSESISPISLWAELKATLWGKVIQILSQIKCECKVDIEPLNKELQSLCAMHKRPVDSATLNRIESIQLSLNLLLTTQAEKSLHCSAAKFYMQKDCIDSILAAKLDPRK